MSEYILSCESTVDLTYQHVKERKLEVIHYTYVIDGEVKEDDMGKYGDKISEFYDQLRNGKMATTTLINQQAYQDYFMELLDKSDNVLHVVFSSGLSSSFSNAVQVAKQINDSHEGKRIEVVDALCGSAGYGLLMDEAADLRDQGKTLDELKKWIEENRLRINHYIFTMDLAYLKRGGRITTKQAVIGGLLNIRLMIFMDRAGRLNVFSKVRSNKKVIKKYISMMEESAEDGLEYKGKCFISHTDSYLEAEELRDEIEANFTHLKGKVKIYTTGPVIGSHTGSGTVGVFFFGKEDRADLLAE